MELISAGPEADKWSEEHKASQFLTYIGQKGRDICRSWTASGKPAPEDNKKLEILFANFEAYCTPHMNIPVQRKHFFESQQGQAESIDGWLTPLCFIARDCAFHDADDMIKDGGVDLQR